uniref:Ovate family protein n=1 Tax=Oryza brachyantha TaxID=4533 RepID=J3LFV3_ORYBR
MTSASSSFLWEHSVVEFDHDDGDCGPESFSGLLRELNQLEQSVASWGRKSHHHDVKKHSPPPPPEDRKKVKNCEATDKLGDCGGDGVGSGLDGSVAVVKQSDDPLGDFRQSMLQMIVENGIVAGEDLREMLRRFLALNAPHHHDVILRAFAEIWDGVFAAASGLEPIVCCTPTGTIQIIRKAEERRDGESRRHGRYERELEGPDAHMGGTAQWRSYLQYKEFIILTDHKSLMNFTDQRLHTLWQQCAYTKAADALSCCDHSPSVEFNDVSVCTPKWLQETRVISALHDSPVGGHSGFPVTYRKVKSLFVWPRIKQQVKSYVKNCSTCQQAKPDRVKYPVSDVAQLYMEGVFKLHDLPLAIVSDWDKIFTSKLWQQLFAKAVTSLNLSSAYRPQSDGQTERVNQYLRQWLDERALMVKLLQHHLHHAQQIMKLQADKRHSFHEFQVGDFVYLKLQPSRRLMGFNIRLLCNFLRLWSRNKCLLRYWIHEWLGGLLVLRKKLLGRIWMNFVLAFHMRWLGGGQAILQGRGIVSAASKSQPDSEIVEHGNVKDKLKTGRRSRRLNSKYVRPQWTV